MNTYTQRKLKRLTVESTLQRVEDNLVVILNRVDSLHAKLDILFGCNISIEGTASSTVVDASSTFSQSTEPNFGRRQSFISLANPNSITVPNQSSVSNSREFNDTQISTSQSTDIETPHYKSIGLLCETLTRWKNLKLEEDALLIFGYLAAHYERYGISRVKRILLQRKEIQRALYLHGACDYILHAVLTPSWMEKFSRKEIRRISRLLIDVPVTYEYELQQSMSKV